MTDTDAALARLQSCMVNTRGKLISTPIVVGTDLAAALAEIERLKAVEVQRDRLVEILKLALEYWAHRQQRYKNRHPAWVVAARNHLGIKQEPA